MTLETWAAVVCVACAAVLTAWGHVASRRQTRGGERDAEMAGFSPTIADYKTRPLVDRSVLVFRHPR